MKLLLILLLFSYTNAQVLVTESDKSKYYVYVESIERFGNDIIFTSKIVNGKDEELQVVIAGCKNRYFMIPSSQITVGKVTAYFTYKNPKRLIAYTNSTMDITLNYICKDVIREER